MPKIGGPMDPFCDTFLKVYFSLYRKLQMNQCLCVKINGLQCIRDASKKSGYNQQFCWQHQNCTKKYTFKKNVAKKNIAKKSIAKKGGPHDLSNGGPHDLSNGGPKGGPTRSPVVSPLPTELLNQVTHFSNVPIIAQKKALKKFGNHPGKVYIIVPYAMGGFFVMRRNQIGQQPQVYYSYDEQYQDYAHSKKFVKGYLPVDPEEGSFLLD